MPSVDCVVDTRATAFARPPLETAGPDILTDPGGVDETVGGRGNLEEDCLIEALYSELQDRLCCEAVGYRIGGTYEAEGVTIRGDP